MSPLDLSDPQLSPQGYGYEKPLRPFPDDVCVVPEKFEGQRSDFMKGSGVLPMTSVSVPPPPRESAPLERGEGVTWESTPDTCFPCSPGDIKQEGVGVFREGPPYQRRGALQLWQFLVALLDDPTNAHFIAWTGRGMEFKLIEPEEVGPPMFPPLLPTCLEIMGSGDVAHTSPDLDSCQTYVSGLLLGLLGQLTVLL